MLLQPCALISTSSITAKQTDSDLMLSVEGKTGNSDFQGLLREPSSAPAPIIKDCVENVQRTLPPNIPKLKPQTPNALISDLEFAS